MQLKKAHVIILFPHGSQHLMQWQQKCRKLHHGFLYVRFHGHNIKGENPNDQWNVCARIKGYLQLKDVILQVVVETL
jgi:hypothetical protein